MGVSHLDLEYNTDSKTSLNVQSDRFSQKMGSDVRSKHTGSATNSQN